MAAVRSQFGLKQKREFHGIGGLAEDHEAKGFMIPKLSYVLLVPPEAMVESARFKE